MIFWSIEFFLVLIEFLKCIGELNWVKIGWNWKKKENWRKINQEANYRSFNVWIKWRVVWIPCAVNDRLFDLRVNDMSFGRVVVHTIWLSLVSLNDAISLKWNDVVLPEQNPVTTNFFFFFLLRFIFSFL